MPVSPNALVAYGILNSAQFGYRLWDASLRAWSSEYLGVAIGTNVNWVVVDSCPTRNEKIAVFVCTDGYIYVCRWDGDSGTWSLEFSVNVGTTVVAYRCAYVAYEQVSGRAIVAYPNPANLAQINYRIWDGTTWSAEATVPTTNTSGTVYFLKLTSKSGSNEVALVYSTSVNELNAIIWDGTAWGNEYLLSTGISVATEQCWDACYSMGVNKWLMVVYSQGTSGTLARAFYYNYWDGTSWSARGSVAIGDYMHWCSLKADPNSDMLVIVYVDNDLDVGAVIWNGSSWGTYYEFDTSAETLSDRCIDAEFETFSGHEGHIIVCYGDGATLSYVHWDGTAWSTPVVITGSSDSPVVQLRRCADGIIHCTVYNSGAGQIESYYWDGASWSSATVFTTTPSTTASPYKEPFMVAPDKHLIPILEQLADSISLTETWTRIISYNKLPIDSITLSEPSFSATKILPVIERILSETLYLSDVLSRTAYYQKTIADLLGISEVFGKTYLGLKTTTESLTLSEFYSKTYSAVRTLEDLLNLLESWVRTVNYNKYPYDSVSLIETALKSWFGYKSFVESVYLSDLLSKTVTGIRTLQEQFSLLESWSRTISYYKYPTDSVSLTDVLTRTWSGTRGFSDLVSLGEWFLVGKVFIRSLSDIAYLTDTLSKYTLKGVFLSDVIYTWESHNNVGMPVWYYFTLSDSILGSDLGLTYTILFLRSLSDLLTLTEVFSKIINYIRPTTESIGLLESFSRVANYYRLSSESISLYEYYEWTKWLARILSESMSLSDVLSRTASYNRLFTDVVNLYDVVIRTASYNKYVSDLMEFIEVFSKVFTSYRAVSDLVSLSDVMERVANYVRSFADLTGLTDTSMRIVNYVRPQYDSVSLIESFIRYWTIFIEFSDIVTLYDVLVKELGRILLEKLTLTDWMSKHFTKYPIDVIQIIEMFSSGKYFVKTFIDVISFTEWTLALKSIVEFMEIMGIDAITGSFIFIPQARVRRWGRL